MQDMYEETQGSIESDEIESLPVSLDTTSDVEDLHVNSNQDDINMLKLLNFPSPTATPPELSENTKSIDEKTIPLSETKPDVIVNMNVKKDEKAKEEEVEINNFVIHNKIFHKGPEASKYSIEELIPFLTKLAVSYQSFGAPANRVEYNMTKCSEAMGIYASFQSMPTSLTITFGSPEMLGSITKSLRIEQNIVETGKMYQIDRLIDKITKHKLDLHQATNKLNKILAQPPHYNSIARIAAYAMASGAAAGLFFHGGWLEICISFFVGIIVGSISQLSIGHQNFKRVEKILCSIVASFIARTASSLFHGTCFISIALASIVWFLPGVSLTLAIRELTTNNMASGTVRLVFAFLTALNLGFGLIIGSTLPFWVKDSVALSSCINGISAWWYILLFFLLSISFNVLLNTKVHQWPGMILTAGVGFSITYVCGVLKIQPDITPSIAAFFVGIIGNMVSRFTDTPGVIFIFSGILFLVPGSIGVQSMLQFFEKNTLTAMEVGFKMIVVGLSITIGTFVANLFIVPSKSFRNRLF